MVNRRDPEDTHTHMTSDDGVAHKPPSLLHNVLLQSTAVKTQTQSLIHILLLLQLLQVTCPASQLQHAVSPQHAPESMSMPIGLFMLLLPMPPRPGPGPRLMLLRNEAVLTSILCLSISMACMMRSQVQVRVTPLGGENTTDTMSCLFAGPLQQRASERGILLVAACGL